MVRISGYRRAPVRIRLLDLEYRAWRERTDDVRAFLVELRVERFIEPEMKETIMEGILYE